MSTRIITGDSMHVLKTMEDESINCVIPSPPYYGLRDYGIDGQMGLEETPEEYIQSMVELFREVRRVLKKDGTLWLNIADSYAGGAGRWGGTKNMSGKQKSNAGSIGEIHTAKPWKHKEIKRKDLIGIPWMLAFALRADGWYLRQDIIWSKPNPMPESVTDRCTKSHEYIFLLSKSPKYYFDYEAIKEQRSSNNDIPPAGSAGAFGPQQSRRRDKGDRRTFRGGMYTEGNTYHNSAEIEAGSHGNKPAEDSLRRKRDVWTIATKPFRGAHFATFPEDLVIPCLIAGCPEGGTTLDPFSGSGTVGVVCKKNNRNFIGIELNPKYAAMAEERIETTTIPNEEQPEGQIEGQVSMF